jgi:putative SOS response-associated peptidase YedK
MCGRFVQISDLREVAPLFGAAMVESKALTSYNITPRQPIAVIVEKGERKIVTMKWGLIPHWAKDETIFGKLINARCESVEEKPSFKDSFKKRRCLIIADGFYEWQGMGLAKRPFYICMKDQRPFGMAGLFDYWRKSDDTTEITCTIVTTEANEIMKPIHHRMPVIISPQDYGLWLDPAATDVAKVKHLLAPCDPDLLIARHVSLLVNNPRNNSQECIVPLP